MMCAAGSRRQGSMAMVRRADGLGLLTLVLSGGVGCGSSSDGSTASSAPVGEPDFEVLMQACRQAVVSLGFEVADALALTGISVDFDGIVLGPGFYVSEGIGEGFVKGDASVLSGPHI